MKDSTVLLPDWEDLSEDYREKVISPFCREVKFRLGSDLDDIVNQWDDPSKKVAMDFGCGWGDSLLLLAGKAGTTVGIDLARPMIDSSFRRLTEAGLEPIRYGKKNGPAKAAGDIGEWRKKGKVKNQTILVEADMGKLELIHDTADIGLAINSITMPDVKTVERAFGQITKCIRSKGVLICVFPSLDTMYHLTELAERHQVEPEGLGSIIEPDGIYVDPEGYMQKYFRPGEIRSLFEGHGWVIDVLEKIRYPWDMMNEFGWGYFPHHERLWDWYVMAHKRK